MKTLFGAIFAVFAAGAFFLFFSPHTLTINGQQTNGSASSSQGGNLSVLPETSNPTSSSGTAIKSGVSDIEKQSQLKNPPEMVKAIYITGWSAGSYNRMTSLINLVEARGLNAVVIDVKDYSGYVSYATDVPEVKTSGAEKELRILRPNELIKRLHDKNIYVIGRITVFQDPILAKAHPEWALQNKTTGKTWKDNHGLAWMDAAGRQTWDYNIAIAKDALGRGFDEINFDYIRFASDGNLGVIGYPFWDEKTPRHTVISTFFSYLRQQLPDAKISADLFGLATIDTWDDLGIGQVIEDAYKYFDYVCPMIYPSHFAAGFMGYKNPANYPYEVIKYSMDGALKRLLGKPVAAATSTATTTAGNATSSSASSGINYRAKLRPWLQAFDLGAAYTSEMIQKQISATDDAFAGSPDKYAGWLLWDPANNYKNFK
ncbi:MAG: hypothetical protein HY432_00030 [Candidatus Liptonbacteria bacterium]|nr:hypothetical protein [Candidatus Liptonbacteria bacterium]